MRLCSQSPTPWAGQRLRACTLVGAVAMTSTLLLLRPLPSHAQAQVTPGCTEGWTVGDIPNPTITAQAPQCGRHLVGAPRGTTSLLCDPDDILPATGATLAHNELARIARDVKLDSCPSRAASGGVQVASVIVNKLKRTNRRWGRMQEAEVFARSLHDKWGLGDPYCQDGALMLTSVEDRVTYISTGAGLERVLTKRRLEAVVDTMKSHMQEGRFDEAVLLGILHLEKYVKDGPPGIWESVWGPGGYTPDQDTRTRTDTHTPRVQEREGVPVQGYGYGYGGREEGRYTHDEARHTGAYDGGRDIHNTHTRVRDDDRHTAPSGARSGQSHEEQESEGPSLWEQILHAATGGDQQQQQQQQGRRREEPKRGMWESVAEHLLGGSENDQSRHSETSVWKYVYDMSRGRSPSSTRQSRGRHPGWNVDDREQPNVWQQLWHVIGGNEDENANQDAPFFARVGGDGGGQRGREGEAEGVWERIQKSLFQGQQQQHEGERGRRRPTLFSSQYYFGGQNNNKDDGAYSSGSGGGSVLVFVTLLIGVVLWRLCNFVTAPFRKALSNYQRAETTVGSARKGQSYEDARTKLARIDAEKERLERLSKAGHFGSLISCPVCLEEFKPVPSAPPARPSAPVYRGNEGPADLPPPYTSTPQDLVGSDRKPIAVLNCGHAFCDGCLKHWLNTNGHECPICRNPDVSLGRTNFTHAQRDTSRARATADTELLFRLKSLQRQHPDLITDAHIQRWSRMGHNYDGHFSNDPSFIALDPRVPHTGGGGSSSGGGGSW